MSSIDLHPMPRGRDVLREQIRILAFAFRREALVIAIVLGIVTLRIAIDIVRGDAGSWFDSEEWFPIAFAAFLFPFGVWRRDRRFGPGFLWTLPVDRRSLALARVFAGWVLLSAVVIVFFVWQHLLASVSGVRDAEVMPLIAFLGATTAYLFGSALVLGLRHPLRWLLGAISVLAILGMLDDGVRMDAILSSTGFVSFAERADAAWRALPLFGQWAAALILGIGAGLAALWAAVSRHGERRRH